MISRPVSTNKATVCPGFSSQAKTLPCGKFLRRAASPHFTAALRWPTPQPQTSGRSADSAAYAEHLPTPRIPRAAAAMGMYIPYEPTLSSSRGCVPGKKGDAMGPDSDPNKTIDTRCMFRDEALYPKPLRPLKPLTKKGGTSRWYDPKVPE
jgi:hypothetical protein